MRPLKLLLAAIVPLVLLLGACGGDDAPGEAASPTADATISDAESDTASAEETEADAQSGAGQTIRVGFIPGPYADMFRAGIVPELDAQGYEVEIEEISDFTIPNQATLDGDIDMNIFQNDDFMNSFNEASQGDLVSILKIPSAPLGLYPGRGSASSPDEIEDGAVIALTSEASNLDRSLRFLETLGLVEVSEVAEGEFATVSDLASNPKNLEFEFIDAPQVPRTLPDVDYGAGLGNHIYAADGVTLDDAIALEEVAEPSQITVVVREGDADAEWAQAIVEAFESDVFREFVEQDPNFSNFQSPSWW